MINKFRRAGTIVLGLALCGFSGPLSAITMAEVTPKAKMGKSDGTALKGQLLVTGSATVNGKRAITGTTVLNESRISVACASGNAAIVNLGKLGRIELTAGAQMVVRFSDGLISGELLTGKAVVNNAAGVKVAVTTPNGVSAADGKEAAALAVNSQKGNRCTPMVAKSGDSSNAGSSSGGAALSAGALAALMAGAGGTAVATSVAVTQKDRSASSTLR